MTARPMLSCESIPCPTASRSALFAPIPKKSFDHRKYPERA